MKQILLQDETHKKLMMLKYKLGFKSLDDLFNIYLGLEENKIDPRVLKKQIEASVEVDEDENSTRNNR